MNHQFGEISLELLVCMGCLSPRNSFSNFDVDKLVRLAEIYAADFDVGDLLLLPGQLRGFVSRARRTQETKMNTSYGLVYRLIELILILLMATTSVERIFFAMSCMKTDLHNKMGDEWLNDLMIRYNEKEIFRSIKNDKIIKLFEDMKTRRMLVPRNNLVI
jgi:hypothetical protein